ncbi:MAG: hypothetical protein LBD67_07975 [Candidatus Accumulibacter sp.]|nr:hypothetical protein [Accumulibacter sp.]
MLSLSNHMNGHSNSLLNPCPSTGYFRQAQDRAGQTDWKRGGTAAYVLRQATTHTFVHTELVET